MGFGGKGARVTREDNSDEDITGSLSSSKVVSRRVFFSDDNMKPSWR